VDKPKNCSGKNPKTHFISPEFFLVKSVRQLESFICTNQTKATTPHAKSTVEAVAVCGGIVGLRMLDDVGW